MPSASHSSVDSEPSVGEGTKGDDKGQKGDVIDEKAVLEIDAVHNVMVLDGTGLFSCRRAAVSVVVFKFDFKRGGVRIGDEGKLIGKFRPGWCTIDLDAPNSAKKKQSGCCTFKLT